MRVEVFGRFEPGAFDLGPLNHRRDGADDARGHLVLEVEDILECAVESVRPDFVYRSKLRSVGLQSAPGFATYERWYRGCCNDAICAQLSASS